MICKSNDWIIKNVNTGKAILAFVTEKQKKGVPFMHLAMDPDSCQKLINSNINSKSKKKSGPDVKSNETVL